MAKKRGRPPKQNKDTDAKVIACLAIGGTFAMCAELIGIDHPAIFYRMRTQAGFHEQILKARALGLECRKMVLEDCLFAAMEMIVDDPRYTGIAIFAAKAMLQWSDIPQQIQNGNTLREVLTEIVRKKRIGVSAASKPDVMEFVKTVQVKA